MTTARKCIGPPECSYSVHPFEPHSRACWDADPFDVAAPTDHPSPEHIAARITGELESITEACRTNPRLQACNLCPDCLTKLEEAIAAALAAKEAAIEKLRDEREHEYLCVDGIHHTSRCRRNIAAGADERWGVCLRCQRDEAEAALTQARARAAQLEGFLVELRDYAASLVSRSPAS